MARRRYSLLLDANVWSAIADDAQAATHLEAISRKREISILACPSVAFEALRTSDPTLRDRLIRVMTRPSWRIVMPEAFDECEELLG